MEAERHFDLIESDLEKRDWLVGEHRAAADLFLLMLTRWGRRPDPPAWERRPGLRAHFPRTYALPGVQRMFEEGGTRAPGPGDVNTGAQPTLTASVDLRP